ncbi:MAG: TSUP family transporter, partial [Bacteroidia bacterium]|nr:TSUP family transporter [Bacteroidia bacterium]
MPESKNTLFPVFLKLENFRVLIIGGGKVALEKIRAILYNSPETNLSIVAADVSVEVYDFLKVYPKVKIHVREYEHSDLDDVDLLIVAISDPQKSIVIKEEATRRKILANVADTPAQCDFYLGSIVQKGQVKIAVSTNGKSPTMAKRIRETFEESFPEEINESLDNLSKIRSYLKGDFTDKVRQLNKITALLLRNPDKINRMSRQRIWIYSLSIPGLLVSGYLFCYFLSPDIIGGYAYHLLQAIDSSILLYIVAGFVAQMIDGALGMAYGVTATTFLLSFGIPPAASSASVHASEVFTSGVSGLMHLKFGNVNTKLFKSLLIPGVLGAILGAYILSSFEEYNYIIKPLVSLYTLILGAIILVKAIRKHRDRQRI